MEVVKPRLRLPGTATDAEKWSFGPMVGIQSWFFPMFLPFLGGVNYRPLFDRRTFILAKLARNTPVFSRRYDIIRFGVNLIERIVSVAS